MEVTPLTDEPRPALTATIHHPSTPLVRSHTDPTYVAVSIGGGATMFFDTPADLRKWHNALAAEIEAMHQTMYDDAVSLTDEEQRLVRLSEIPPGAHVWRNVWPVKR
jgi:hypothetical protein